MAGVVKVGTKEQKQSWNKKRTKKWKVTYELIDTRQPKKTSAKKTSAKKTSAKKTSAKKTSAKKTSVKKTSAKKTSAKR